MLCPFVPDAYVAGLFGIGTLRVPIEPTMQSPRAATAAVIAGGVLTGACIAAGVTLAMKGGQPSVILAVATVVASGVVALLPIFLSGTVPIARWGMLAFTGTLAQPMLVAAIGFAFDKSRTLDRQAFWIGCLVGAITLLIVQVAWAISTLSKAQRAWDGAHKVTTHTPTPTEAV